MRPQEKLFFKSPAAIALQHLASITQVWRFQRAQAELLLASHRHAARRHRAAMEEAKRELGVKERELESLRRENTELRRAQLSPGWRGGSRSSTPRPVGVTSPAHTGKVPPAPPYLGFTLTPNPAFTRSDPAAPAATQLPGGQPLSPAGAPPDSQHPAVAPGQRLRGRAHPLGLQRRRKDPESGGFLPKPPRPTQPLAIGHAPFAKAPPLYPYMILISLNPSPHLHM
ncbi:E3 ubiquitin-protein ligase RNF212B-like isoform 1-T1 [Guaruba guarouba]